MKIFFLVVAILASIAATVLAFLFIIPEKKRAKLNKIGKFAHDFLNFKFLIIEKILQALYVLCTAFSVVFGFFMLFFFEKGYTYYSYSGYAYHTRAKWYGGWGLLLMIVGPIAIRLVYEGLMMAILLVKNVIQINNKIKGEAADTNTDAPAFTPVEAAPVAAPVATPVAAPIPANVCPNCRNELVPGSSFCTYCGTPVNNNWG